LAGITGDDLAQAYLRGAAERPIPRVDLAHVTVDTVSVFEAVAELIAVPRDRRATSFRLLVEDCTTRIEVIVRFLALLELCKLGRVSLGQGHTFGDLRIDWLEMDEAMAGHSSGRGLGEMSGIEIEEYEG
jgi:segregation and condensation protein A